MDFAMKHLLAMFCVASFALCSEAFNAGREGFEDRSTGKLNPNSDRFWHTESANADESAVAEYGKGKFLDVAAPVSPLYRSLEDNGGKMPKFCSISGDVVFDAEVRFTPAEPGVPALETDTKFALSLIVDDDNLKTNLVVTAAGPTLSGGYYAAENYCLDVENVNPSKWYRVTVRAIADTGVGMLGFVVYIDGNIVSCSDSDYFNKLPVLSGFNAVSRYLIESRQFFASCARSGTNGGNKLSAIGFKGVGSIDELTICDVDESAVSSETINSSTMNFVVDGEPYSTLNGAMRAAVAAGADGRIPIAKMCTDYMFASSLMVDEGDFVLDVAGHELILAADEIPVNVGNGNITIIDSAGGGSIVNAGTSADHAIFCDAGAGAGIVTIGMADSQDKGVSISGRLVPPDCVNASTFLKIVRGRFNDKDVARECAEKPVSVCEDCGQYCVVSPNAISPDESAERFSEEAALSVEMAIRGAVAEILSGDNAVEGYMNLFRRVVARPEVDGGRYVVVFELDPEAVAEMAAAEGATMPDDAVAEIPMEEVAASGGSVDVEKSIPGLYYTVISGTDPGEVNSPGTSVLGTGGKISLDVPTRGEKGFYRIKLSATPQLPTND